MVNLFKHAFEVIRDARLSFQVLWWAVFKRVDNLVSVQVLLRLARNQRLRQKRCALVVLLRVWTWRVRCLRNSNQVDVRTLIKRTKSWCLFHCIALRLHETIVTAHIRWLACHAEVPWRQSRVRVTLFSTVCIDLWKSRIEGTCAVFVAETGT